jgi:hypothetical protein
VAHFHQRQSVGRLPHAQGRELAQIVDTVSQGICLIIVSHEGKEGHFIEPGGDPRTTHQEDVPVSAVELAGLARSVLAPVAGTAYTL